MQCYQPQKNSEQPPSTINQLFQNQVEHPILSLDDSGRDIFLMNPDIMDYWPSLTSSLHSEAMSGEKFKFQIGQMHEFLTLVLKIAFSHLYRDPEIPEASQIYDSFFPKK